MTCSSFPIRSETNLLHWFFEQLEPDQNHPTGNRKISSEPNLLGSKCSLSNLFDVWQLPFEMMTSFTWLDAWWSRWRENAYGAWWMGSPRLPGWGSRFFWYTSKMSYPPWNYHSSWKWMVGRWVSFWEGLLQGAMLVCRAFGIRTNVFVGDPPNITPSKNLLERHF